ncbi:sensor histidine kinase [Flammeovirga kamogawensis]|uniref:Histidine kinase n=1 Tax=Flammeovirga kamogawensis TaxID=373891 RepID=A0ABX8GUG4_9BACT|nr:histidine kinase [Flammeovirga kamogawensis]MBB6459909.1 sensor histidine kinase YesM [Flammeovirga kamogawensis]QWG07038.1 histidine kinase [Flammeovirga kamogawensis]TRX68859.1 hypothetical protein EO216_12295 [Flammeovirga kamogawensis]
MSLQLKNKIKQDTVWQVLLILAYFFLTFNFFNERFGSQYALMKTLLLIGSQIFIWQININYLLPQLLLKKKNIIYILVLFAMVIIISFLYQKIERYIIDSWKLSVREELMFPFDDPEFRNRSNRPGIKKLKRGFKLFESSYNLILFSVVALASTAYKMTTYSLKQENEASSLREEKVKSEMDFLKSQVNPHFLFNVLNNIYSLSFLKSDKTPDVVLQLSDMLRYMLYDTGTATVPLQKEIDYLNNFIGLHILKDDAIKENIAIDWDIQNSNLPIAPLLFAPFIENAFKHSHIEDEINGWIKISLSSSLDGQITFKINNSKPLKKLSKDKQGGIGLENVKKRLNLQYKNKHSMAIHDSSKEYSIILNINTQ